MEPAEILAVALEHASKSPTTSLVSDQRIRKRVDLLCRNLQNRAGVRLLLASLLAKIHNPKVDIRKPYTEIGGPDTYSGRSYDESYISPFIHSHRLPTNPTTAFLTPALRNRNIVLTPDVDLVGRPPEVYKAVLQLLTDVHTGKVRAEDLLAETIRVLVQVRDEQDHRMQSLVNALSSSEGGMPLSSEEIVALIEQHLKSRGASRLPVLIVAAAYKAASKRLGEKILTLASHNAADEQTGALGDVEVTLIEDTGVVTSYEMKLRRVIRDDIDRALQKVDAAVKSGKEKVHNYIFITTEKIDENVKEYAKSLYEETGVEFAVLDCISFLRHFLHLFHRLRMDFLEAYQELVLSEPHSA